MSEFIVSARKYRPKRFDEVVGQEHVSQTLKNALQSGHLAHAFLFCGPRGASGKGVYKQMYLHLKKEVEMSSDIRGLRLYVEKDNANAQKVYSKLGMDGQHYKMFEWMKQ